MGRRQCSEYVQSRVFEAMLEFQVTAGNIPGAVETIKCAKSLDIRITADYLQMYLKCCYYQHHIIVDRVVPYNFGQKVWCLLSSCLLILHHAFWPVLYRNDEGKMELILSDEFFLYTLHILTL